jgi:plasmid stability protein
MICMSTIQVRNVPEDLHRRLKARAAGQGRTLSDYVLDELRVAADRPTMSEWLAAVETLPPPAHPPAAAADVLADERRR